MIVIGIDPGYHRCGFGVMECDKRGERLAGSGCIVTKPTDTLPVRLHCIAIELDQIFTKWQPDAVAVEEIFFAKNVKTAIGVAQARGVILERATAQGIEVFEYTPTSIKSQLTGNGRAQKQQVEFMVRKLVGTQLMEKRLDDELDAIAVAICHVQQSGSKLSRLTKGY